MNMRTEAQRPMRDLLARLPLLTMTPEQFGALMRADNAKYAEVIKTAKIKID